ncbi:MAG: DegV family protein [Eubacteriales bacterium]|jgi:DegV family protein with EDD domain
MANVKILMDSGGDVPKDLLEQYDITIVPLNIIFDGEEFVDYYGIDREEYYRRLKTCRDLPKTSQPNPYTFLQYFHRFEDRYDEILYVGMSSNGSGTYNSACMAAEEYKTQKPKARVLTFDSWNATLGIGYYAIKAGEFLEKGLDVDAIWAKLHEMRRNFASYMIPETMEFLKKGGRVNTVTSVIGGLLDIRPIITIHEGWGRNYGKVRGAKQAVTKLAELYREQHGDNEVYISHSNCLERAEELIELLRKTCEDLRVVVTEMGSTLTSHAGPGTIGIHFLRKDAHTLA